jgi:hypothetical protein
VHLGEVIHVVLEHLGEVIHVVLEHWAK